MKKVVCILIIQFIIIKVNSQTLNGVWKGWSEKKFSVASPTSIKLEVSKINDSTFSGVLHISYKKKLYEHIKISAKFNEKDSTFYLSEDSLISYKKHLTDEICLGKSALKLTKTDSSSLLTGIWKDKKRGLFKCPNIKMSYEQLNKTNLVKENREPDIQRVIDLSRALSDSIKIEIFDNGVVDGDSISLFLNEKLICKNIRLKETPFTTFISLSPNIEFNKLLLRAENLGEIPPNTAYMIVTTKKETYRIYLTSTLNKNGIIEFQFTD